MKRKYLIIILLPLLLCSFLSVGFAQISVDTSIISMSGTDWSLKVDSALASSIDSRNTPYMTAKSPTEKELFLELASLEDCKSGVVQFKVDMAGLTAYKQYPLTQEEIDVGSFRPKNVENSFALFDDSGRKVAHIYGSKIVDAKGVEVWLDQDLSEGLLTVYLPKPEILETLSFPLLLDPTFGYTSVGASSENWNNVTLSANYTLGENGEVTSLMFYMTNAFTESIYGAIYYENGTKIAETTSNATTNGDGIWLSLPFTSPVDLVSGNYFLSVYWLNSGVNYWFDTAGGVYWADTTKFPSVIDGDTSQNSRKLSIYAVYEVDGEPTPTPSPSPTPVGATATPFPEGAMDDTDWWISILVLLLIIINIFLMMLPFALVRFTFGILSLFLCMLALSYQVPLSPYLQTAGLLISALAMLFSVRARE